MQEDMGASSFYLTCRNCAVDRTACQRRSEIAAGIKGLGLTSVKFRCPDRQPLYHPGQRVRVTWAYYPPDWGYEDGYSMETWPATVIDETRKGFIIAVDDVPSDNDLPAREYIKNENLYCNVSAKKLAPLDEPDRQVCGYCRQSVGLDGAVQGCWRESGTVVANCLAQAIESRQGGNEVPSADESAVHGSGCAQGGRP